MEYEIRYSVKGTVVVYADDEDGAIDQFERMSWAELGEHWTDIDWENMEVQSTGWTGGDEE